MGLLKRSADLVYTLRFLKLLVTPFNKTTAFKLGIIDDKGKRNKNVTITSSEMASAYTPFHRLVFNIKKIVGTNKLTSYASALYLIKERYNMSDKSIDRIIRETGVDVKNVLEEDSRWFLLENNQLAPGIYRVKTQKVLNSTYEEIVNKNDKIKILEDSFPIENICGINIYKAIHVRTNQEICVSVGELIK